MKLIPSIFSTNLHGLNSCSDGLHMLDDILKHGRAISYWTAERDEGVNISTRMKRHFSGESDWCREVVLSFLTGHTESFVGTSTAGDYLRPCHLVPGLTVTITGTVSG